MNKKAKMFSILALGVLLVLGAVFVYAGTSSEEAESVDVGGGVEAMGCSNFCTWCVPINGNGLCSGGGSCC